MERQESQKILPIDDSMKSDTPHFFLPTILSKPQRAGFYPF